MIGVINTHCFTVRYPPGNLLLLFLYFLACSSDQKKTDCFQNESIILGSDSVVKSTSGIKTSGWAPELWTTTFNLLSISIDMAFEQQAHLVSILTFKSLFLNHPCTKGNANASIAHAAWVSSPVEKYAL